MTLTEAPTTDVLLAAFSAFSQPCLLTTIRGDITMANTSALALFGAGRRAAGQSPPGIEGCNLGDLIGADRSSLARDLRIAASSPSTPLRFLIHSAPYSVVVSTLCAGKLNGSPSLLLTFSEGSVIREQFSDLRTKVRRANERALQERRKRADLIARYEQLQQFSYAMAHDLKAPVRRISNYLSLFVEENRECLGGEACDLIDKMESSVNRLSTLISDIMIYGETTGSDLQFESVEVRSVVDEILDHRSPSLEEAAATVRVEDHLGFVDAVPPLFKRVLSNLVENAIKYRSELRPLELCMSTIQDSDGRATSLTVTDNGIGFDPARAERLFDPFKRDHSGSVPGSGIGLATCKIACELQGWSIKAQGEPDKFASFTITFSDRP